MLLFQLNYGLAEAGILSTTFEVGGVVGSALVGVFIDRYVLDIILFIGSAGDKKMQILNLHKRLTEVFVAVLI